MNTFEALLFSSACLGWIGFFVMWHFFLRAMRGKKRAKELAAEALEGWKKALSDIDEAYEVCGKERTLRNEFMEIYEDLMKEALQEQPDDADWWKE